ncbi:MAG: class A beta-lactamase-related serine hydrolase [Deltaproteobacteria bacterium]|nr:class A beta-lactamase-related serine hydrolase [Deltaproteobacteria bacterium]
MSRLFSVSIPILTSKEIQYDRRQWTTGIVLILLSLSLTLGSHCIAGESPPLPPQPVFSKQLQGVLDQIVAQNLKRQPDLASKNVHLALIDLANPEKPLLAEYNGHKPVYPSSVIKMVYMGYVYQLEEEGALKITPQVYRKLYQMIHPSSNTATAWIIDLWSGTCGGEQRSPEDYREFAQDRNACNRWLRSLGIENINACQKTWGCPIPPGEKQFLRGGKSSGPWVNRNSMTAVAAVRFLQILAADALVTPESSEEMRELMVRDVRNQSYQRMRIAGGTPRGTKVFSKTGTTADTFHDAGIVVLPNGREFILAVFITGKYRGSFIRNVSMDLCNYFMGD